MKSNSAPKPFSAGELAAGLAALAAVALIAFVGLRVPRQQVPAPAEPSGVANTVVPSSRNITRAAGEQLSERGPIRKSQPVAAASAKAGSAFSTPLHASRAVTSSGSAAAPSPTPSADSIPARLANAAGNASAQIAGRQQASADQAPVGQAPTQQPTWTDLLLAPPPANRPSRSAAPVDAAAAEPVAGPIPLPRERPHPMALAEAAMPLPQPRPDAAGPERAPAGLGNWLGGIFQSSPSSAAEPEPVQRDDY
jgi:hypothetical protein